MKEAEDLCHAIEDARLCRACDLVTTELHCPTCEVLTVEHPERGMTDGYCWRCAEPVSIAMLRLETWEDDPYIQTSDGMLITACKPCLKKEYGEEDDE